MLLRLLLMTILTAAITSIVPISQFIYYSLKSRKEQTVFLSQEISTLVEKKACYHDEIKSVEELNTQLIQQLVDNKLSEPPRVHMSLMRRIAKMRISHNKYSRLHRKSQQSE